jgi:phosphonate transport system substrate-binding protein
MLRVGVLPDQRPPVLQARYGPLVGHLSEMTGVPFRYIPCDSYDHLLEKITQGQIDLAYLGGVTYVKASQRSSLIPLVMRRRDTRFTSYFLVRSDHPAHTFQDLKGQRMAFGAELSTSGHYMPRHFLAQEEITPETFFSSVSYTGSHDVTALAVLHGQADVGAANAAIVDQMRRDHRIGEGQLRVLWETPPYADYVWALRSNLPQELTNRIRNAFLMLDPTQSAHQRVLEPMAAQVFLPARNEDFASLAAIIQKTENRTREHPAGDTR